MDAQKVSFVSDLRVKRESLEVIRPQNVTEGHSLYLSNLDQKFVGFVSKFVHFFAIDMEIPFDAVVYVHTQALSNLMIAYDFICGRLVFNSEQGRFEIDCNAAGVPFAVCTSELGLQDLGDISYPNPAFVELFHLVRDANQTPEDKPLITIQLTRFKCGGFALGTAFDHCLMDGFAMQGFLRNLIHLAETGNLAFQPVIDRTCLKARSPLQIKYEHEGYKKPSEISAKEMNSSPFALRNKDVWYNKAALHRPSKEHVFGLFSLPGKMLEVLKMKAKLGGVNHCTSYIAALAHLWRARTAAIENMAADDISTVQFTVDIRSKLVPPLPREFAGNGILQAYGRTTVKQLKEQPFYETVKMLVDGVERMSDDYLRSTIDWIEFHDGVPSQENGFFAATISNMGFGDLKSRSGVKLVYAGPVVSGNVNMVIFLAHPTDKDGLQIYIGLEAADMTRFRKLIRKIDGMTIYSNM